MNEQKREIYKSCANSFLDAGYNPVPVRQKKKGAANPDWNKHVPELPSEVEVAELKGRYADGNIGLATGTRLVTGRFFAAVDVDTPGFVSFVKKALRSYVSGKIGSKGLTVFCQADASLKSAKLKTKGKKDYGVELMIDTGMIVIPPSIHPNGNEYKWDGKSLLDLTHDDLPVLDAVTYAVIKHVVTNQCAWDIVEGGVDVQGNVPMLGLTASGVALLTDDLEWLAECLNALFHPDYDGDTKEKDTLRLLRTAKEKGLGAVSKAYGQYVAADTGPLPLGYLEDGRYVFLDQGRSLLLMESSNRLTSEGTLMNMAPLHFWLQQFPRFSEAGKLIGVDCRQAADTLMQACRRLGGFDTTKVRGRGVYLDAKGRVIVNWGDKVPSDTKHVYVCYLPLTARSEEPVEVDPSKVLELFRQFRWSNPSEPYLVLGWAVLAVICGVLDWRPHLFISGRKNSGKTTLILALMSILEPIGIALDGQSTEAGIRQKLGPDSRPVMADEFESDQNVGRMKSVIKLIRSSSSAKYTIARGTPEGKALEFCIRSTFLLGAINPFTVTSADRSRIVVLTMQKHDNNKDISNKIAELSQALEDTGPSWCRLVIDNVHHILAAIKTMQRVFPPCESRHALNMASLLAGAWVILHQREMTGADAETLIVEHSEIIGRLADAHDEDDSVECLNALLGYQTKHGPIGVLLAMIKYSTNLSQPKIGLQEHGIRWEKDGFIVANSHPGIKKVFEGTLWAEGGWVSALARVDGAEKSGQLRFSGGVRSLSTWIPAKYITEDYEKLPAMEF